MEIQYLLFVGWLLVFCNGTPLDDYVHAPDPTFSWSLKNSFQGLGYTAYNIRLISQKWMTSKQSNDPIWQHWLTVCVPDDVLHTDMSFLWIDGGHTNDPAPTDVNLAALAVCVETKTVSSALLQIPNEPIIFENDGRKRTEDAMIAYTWAHFFNDTSDPTWLARLPMTKAAVKAMDAVQNFTSTLSVPKINRFMVAGASKRGWVTWCTGAVDSRVAAMAPIVIPVLNVVPNFNHHYRSLGEWSFALDDYLEQGIMKYLNEPIFKKLTDIVDPIVYKSRMTMPKLLITAGGDEFFLPDSPQFFLDQLEGETHLFVVPDAEHSLITGYLRVISSISSFFLSVIHDHPRPKYSYQLVKSNTTAQIIVEAVEPPPTYVTMWYAYTLDDKRRDFRLLICDKIPDCLRPVIWIPESIPLDPKTGKYIAEMKAPSSGWAAFLVEMRYDLPLINAASFIVTTEVNIVPDTLPFPPCGNHCQPSA